jgi:hypothetical protein
MSHPGEEGWMLNYSGVALESNRPAKQRKRIRKFCRPTLSLFQKTYPTEFPQNLSTYYSIIYTTTEPRYLLAVWYARHGYHPVDIISSEMPPSIFAYRMQSNFLDSFITFLVPPHVTSVVYI